MNTKKSEARNRPTESIDDLKIKFEADEDGSVQMYHRDINNNLVKIGVLTHAGATRLIGRIANIHHLDVVIRTRAK